MTAEAHLSNRLAVLRRHAMHLDGVEPDRDPSDLHGLGALIGDARIVGLGEATHGSREFFLLKHRLIRVLVADLGFTVVVLEAGWPECEVVNAYVLDGHGDPAWALSGLGYWTWDTEEALALIRWLREWNAAREPARRVRFAGVDVRAAGRAVEQLQAALVTVDVLATMLARELGPVAGLHVFDPPTEDEETVWPVLGQLRDRFDQVQPSAASLTEWQTARHHLRILEQIAAVRHATSAAERFTARDRAMAANVDHLLQDGGSAAKVVVWAHNAHIARSSEGLFAPNLATMGKVLAERHGEQYVAVGFAFGTGSFQAIVDEDSPRLVEIRVGPPPPGSLDADLLEGAQTPAFLLPLRNAPDPLGEWLQREHITREVGAVFSSEADMLQQIVPVTRYDILACVAHTTRARPTETGDR